MTRWVTETLHPEMHTAYRCDRVLYETRTEQQHLVLFENALFGRMLALDGIIQVTGRDEFIYHEMMTHVPLLAHGRARRVLVIGGGDGGVAREVLRHRAVERVVMVEIDESVVAFSRQYLPEISAGAFDDPRLELVIDDGAAFVARTTERFDVIIVDSTDPVGPGAVLFSDDFYGHAAARLADGGVIVTQNGVPFLQGDELVSTMRSFRSRFQVATCFIATIPTYVGGPMAMGFGTRDTAMPDVTESELAARFAAAGLRTRYYTPAVHRGAFALPGYIVRLVRPD